MSEANDIVKKPKIPSFNKWHIFWSLPPFTGYFVAWYVWFYIWKGAKNWFPGEEKHVEDFANHKRSLPIFLFALILANALWLGLPHNHFFNIGSYQVGVVLKTWGGWIQEDIARGFKTDGL
ncbi:hypothetical protein [Burkholderia contaminans]|uniref:hypothetical protein n=1 Tax=Burkholderia contaminans TaxID=488447 RepID=UPI00158C3E98|nr:hypothetical protein [Burkholderia contaminans]